MPAEQSPDPRAKLETELRALAECLREHPTVPGEGEQGLAPMPEVFDDEAAVLLPPKHCAFRGCTWHLQWPEPDKGRVFERTRERQLVEHVRTAHLEAIRPVLALLPQVYTEEERTAAAYNEAIAVRVRGGAPLASYSIDRRCLRKAAEAPGGTNIQALICFMCACVFPYREEEAAPAVRWYHGERLFAKYGPKNTERWFGLSTYLEKYGTDPSGYYDLRRHMVEFEDWWMDVPFDFEKVRVLCCPEDRTCTREACAQGRVL